MGSSLPRRAFLVAALAAVSAVPTLAAPQAAQADRCQPEELVGLPAVTREDVNPACIVVSDVAYPALACDSVTLRQCLNTLDAVATATNAPGTAAATPARTVGAVQKMPDAAKPFVCSAIGPPLGLNPDTCGATSP